ncbi:hypothetical protein J1N35_001801 [Gossypium stocksii]|uniref:Uncharacterized protein n=1 Tax=Gossypium stocksii TaxID=47602 RepID=A0A9D3WL03_9ROSI|nr:hypothetical protein J1N35_001801 [Gossypium stocksii]
MVNSVIRFDDKHISVNQAIMDECTITLEDVALQLDLLVAKSIVTGSVVIPDKEDLCEAFLGKMSDKFQGGQKDMKWLETNFRDLPLNALDVVKEQYT